MKEILTGYDLGVEDAEEGYPPNRYMRDDAEYMRGYNSIAEAKEAAK